MFEDRHLSFNKFLDERAEEISKFRDILKLDTKKKGHQALPKCVRRRAMSHNRYRIPSKLRKMFEEQLIKSENMLRLPKCRKHIRKSPRLILSYKERHSKIKWLSTHLWSAKRMRMIDYHGYKVAETPNEKAFRSSYRHFMHNCCMVDMSYFQCLSFYLSDSSSQLPSFLTILDDRNKLLRQNLTLNDLQMDRSYDGCFYDRENRLICPVIIFNCGKQSLQQQKYVIRCFFNPCALDQVSQLVSDKNSNEFELGKCKSQLYCLLGPEWQNKFHQALKIYGLTPNIQTLDQLKFNPKHAQFFIPDQQTNTQTVPHISNQIYSLIKQTYQTSQQSANIRQQTLKLFEMLTQNSQPSQQQKYKSSQQAQPFWSSYQSILSHSQKVNIKITTRSKYTHKRKNKMSKELKKKVAALQTKKKQLITSKNAIQQDDQESASHEMISESLQNIKNEIKEFFIDEKESKGLHMQQENKEFKEKTYKVNPVLVTSFRKQSLYQGCYILCSDEDSCRLWRVLSKLNIKVVGLQELKHITLQSQHLSFPQNYPETKSFQNYAQTQALKQMRRMKRLPPSKRINFLKINSPNPFSLLEKSLVSNSQKVFVQMVNRGRCFTNSYIYELSQEDIGMIAKELQNGKIGIILTETSMNKHTNGTKLGSKKFLDYSKQNLQSLEQKLSELKEKRQLIGRVLTGGYLYTKSKEGGIGYVTRQVGNQVDDLKNDGYVLIRKVTSPHYYLGQITKIYPNLNRQ